MHVVFLNPQGNFDPKDSYLTEHPDFGGQLVYVKEVAIAMAAAGHKVDIATRQINDPDWPEFAEQLESYPDHDGNPRIVRIPCGGPSFLAKEQLWPHLPEFIDRLVDFYGDRQPDAATAHYGDGGYCAVLLHRATGIPFTFTGHSLGAQKLDKLGMSQTNAEPMEERYRFSTRIAAERMAMERAARIITSTDQERRQQYAHPLYAGAVDVDDDQKFSVIPPGVNMSIFSTERAADEAILAPDVMARIEAVDLPVVVVSNRLDEKKNTLGVVEAFVRSEPLRNRARLALCVRGMDDPFQELDTLNEAEQQVLRPILESIEQNGLKEQVLFLNIPSQRALAAAYRAVARGGGVFALTAFYEPFGLAPIEAAACGLACVATRNGGPSEIFADGSGILVDPSDSDDIARGLNEALDRQAELAVLARKRVLSTYTWNKTADAYAGAIEQILKAGRVSDTAVPALDGKTRLAAYLAEQ